MSPLTVGVLRETAPGERRVALSPDGVSRLRALGLEVEVESGAGAGAFFDDADYVAAGARITLPHNIVAGADVVVCVQGPGAGWRDSLRLGQVLLGLLGPLADPAGADELARAGVTALSLDGLPRTLSAAQSMDALTSQATVAGYKSVLVAAAVFPGFFPMLMTAAGTVRPATVLVLGAGVAGLQALGTARRLGAVVTGSDVREAARGEVTSTGATFLDLGAPASAGTAGGYARALDDDEQHAQQQALAAAIGRFDVVITTAQVPGRRPPVLVPAAALAALRPGSVVVDLGASPLGGNVEGSVDGSTTVTDGGVTVIGAGALPSTVPVAASVAYSRNVCALLAHLVVHGALTLDPTDAITAGVLVSRDGAVVHPGVLALLTPSTPETATPETAAPETAAPETVGARP